MEKVLILQWFSVFSVALKTSGNREGGKNGRKWVILLHDNRVVFGRDAQGFNDTITRGITASILSQVLKGYNSVSEAFTLRMTKTSTK